MISVQIDVTAAKERGENNPQTHATRIPPAYTAIAGRMLVRKSSAAAPPDQTAQRHCLAHRQAPPGYQPDKQTTRRATKQAVINGFMRGRVTP